MVIGYRIHEKAKRRTNRLCGTIWLDQITGGIWYVVLFQKGTSFFLITGSDFQCTQTQSDNRLWDMLQPIFQLMSKVLYSNHPYWRAMLDIYKLSPIDTSRIPVRPRGGDDDGKHSLTFWKGKKRKTNTPPDLMISTCMKLEATASSNIVLATSFEPNPQHDAVTRAVVTFTYTKNPNNFLSKN